jgi:hypothetical protein
MHQLGVFLNTIKRLLDILRPKIENKMKSWVACLPMPAELSFGERLNEVTVLLRAKYKNFLQAIIEKLFDNVKYLFLFLSLGFRTILACIDLLFNILMFESCLQITYFFILTQL